MSQTPDMAEAFNFLTTTLARSPLGGKKNSTVTVRMTDEQKFDLDRRAHELGMSTSEVLERLSAVMLYGLEHVQMVEQKRTAMVCGLFSAEQQKGSQ